MSTYFNFLKKINPHLKSVRKLETHISYDLLFPDTWLITKTKSKNIEVIKNGNPTNGMVQLSFVCPINENIVTEVEDLVDNIIKSNKEREEKEKLFRSKVQELKSIFEKEKLEDLKSLKFDVDEITKLIGTNGEENNDRPRSEERVESIEDGNSKV